MQLPRRLRKKARNLLDQIDEDLEWNALTGEVTIIEDDEHLPNSNIIDIVYHALNKEKNKLEPTAYSDVYPFLPKGSTPPVIVEQERERQLAKERDEEEKNKKKKKRKRKKKEEEETLWKDIRDSRMDTEG